MPGEKYTIEVVKGGSNQVLEIPDADHYSLMVEAFNQALLQGEKQVVPHSESLSNLEVLDRIRADLI